MACYTNHQNHTVVIQASDTPVDRCLHQFRDPLLHTCQFFSKELLHLLQIFLIGDLEFHENDGPVHGKMDDLTDLPVRNDLHLKMVKIKYLCLPDPQFFHAPPEAPDTDDISDLDVSFYQQKNPCYKITHQAVCPDTDYNRYNSGRSHQDSWIHAKVDQTSVHNQEDSHIRHQACQHLKDCDTSEGKYLRQDIRHLSDQEQNQANFKCGNQ